MAFRLFGEIRGVGSDRASLALRLLYSKRSTFGLITENAVKATMASILISFGAGLCSPALAKVPLPEVACTGDFKPQKAFDQNKLDLPDRIASRLDIYTFDSGMILGPRGWACETRTDGYEGIVSVVPKHIYKNLIRRRSPDINNGSQGIVEVFVDGDSTDDTIRNMETWGNTYFSNAMRRSYRYQGGALVNAKRKRYETDILHYASPTFLTYVTPPNRNGLGDDIFLGFGCDGPNPSHRALPAPINGFLKVLTTQNERAYQVDIFAIVMTKTLSKLQPYIQYYAMKSAA